MLMKLYNIDKFMRHRLDNTYNYNTATRCGTGVF